MSTTREQLTGLLADKELRGHFTSAQVYRLLASQIRHLREKRQWTQADLGARAAMQQVQISRAENPDYRGTRISTLGKLAEAFDVGLMVRFAPFSEMAAWLSDLSLHSLEPASFDEERLQGRYRLTSEESVGQMAFSSLCPGEDQIIDLNEYKARKLAVAEDSQLTREPGVPRRERRDAFA
jgi:transcriptional regulator with XRE-family HTH domain